MDQPLMKLVELYCFGAAAFAGWTFVDLMKRKDEARIFFRRESPWQVAVGFVVVSFLLWWIYMPLFLANEINKRRGE